MAALTWDSTGERKYQTGVSKGVLYPMNNAGLYPHGVAWNGLISVAESPSGGEETALWADNIKFLSLVSVEEYGGTIEAYMYPDEWAACDGSASPVEGVYVHQQTRQQFGLSYESIIGNDIDGNAHGTKIHLVWGARATPSERTFSSVNDSPEAITFSWTFTTTPLEVGEGFKPTSLMTIDCTTAPALGVAQLRQIIHGSATTEPRLPTPDEVVQIFQGADPAGSFTIGKSEIGGSDTIS